MKKSLVALAALAATGLASAQSSVTLFGIVDATWAHGSGSGAGSASRTQLTNSGYNSSRLGFRGTEDLGGGMAASFWLEAGVNNDDGRGAATNTNNQATGGAAAGIGGSQGLTFNRRSTVSLSGGWGEVRLGRDYSPQFWNLTVFDPFGYNGVGTTQVGFMNNANFTGVTAVRVSNSVAYFLPPNLGGFYGQVTYYQGENLHNGAATQDDGRGWGGRIGYGSGPFNVALAASNTDYASGDVSTWNLGGQWDFGVAKLMGHYEQDKIKSIVPAVANTKGKGWLIGGLVPVGAGEIRIAYSTYKVDLPGTGVDPRSNKWALGYVHNLSKRTALYATYAHVNNKNGAATSLNGSVTAANSGSSGYDLGIRHSF
jgi:predicted porin